MDDQVLSAPVFFASLLIGMLLFLELGRRVGIRRIRRADEEQEVPGAGTVDGAAFALLGLLVAFTFSGAAERFDSRRMLIAEEANDIGTAYLRLDLLPEQAQPELRQSFRDYLDARIEFYRKYPGLEAGQALSRADALQGKIWKQSVAATWLAGVHPDGAKLLLPALNTMIDITTTRAMASRIHPPTIIYLLLFALALVCSLLAGRAMAASKARSWLHILGFVGMTVIAVYVILDIEHPRRGFFRIDAYDQVLADLRQTMK